VDRELIGGSAEAVREIVSVREREAERGVRGAGELAVAFLIVTFAFPFATLGGRGAPAPLALWDAQIRFVELIGGNRILESGKAKREDLAIFSKSGCGLGASEVRTQTVGCHSDLQFKTKRKFYLAPRSHPPS
jgi:hypothetical protein